MKYYGVKKGVSTGVYTSWNDCKKQVDGYKGAQYKSFSTKKEAEEYVDIKSVKVGINYTEVWTDGACSDNGGTNAKAGIGVFFGDSDSRNISESFTSPRPSNQRAEVYAIIRALETLGDNDDILIYTDSMYAINSMEDWIHGWRKNNWNSNKVVNRDLLERLDNLIQSRSGKVEFRHVNGHIGIYGNEMADMLAVQGSRI
jgi:ribonuclease HI